MQMTRNKYSSIHEKLNAVLLDNVHCKIHAVALNVAKPGHVLLACSFCQVLGQSLITFRVVWKIVLEHRPSRMSASLVWSTYNMYCVHKALFRFIFTLVTWGRTNRLVGATLLPLGMNPKNIWNIIVLACSIVEVGLNHQVNDKKKYLKYVPLPTP